MSNTARTTFVLITVFTASHVAFGEKIRVATYNVNYDNRCEDDLADAITASNADIVCLQETTRRSTRLIRERLSQSHPEFRSEGQFAFASRIAPRESEFHDQPGFFTATFAGCDQEYLVVNIHLAPVMLPADPGVLDVIRAVSTSARHHETEIAAILNSINASVPTIVVGDFNSLSTSIASARMREHGFVDSFASIHADADLHPTWDLRKMLALEPHVYRKDSLGVLDLARPLQLGLRVDYVFHSRHFRTLKSKIIESGGSDHFLIVSELEFGEPSDAKELGPLINGVRSAPVR